MLDVWLLNGCSSDVMLYHEGHEYGIMLCTMFIQDSIFWNIEVETRGCHCFGLISDDQATFYGVVSMA